MKTPSTNQRPRPSTHARGTSRLLRRSNALHRLDVVILPVLLAALASVMATALPVPAAAATTPFTADVALHASLAATPQPGVFTATTAGAGQASHLGQVTYASTETLDFATAPGSTVVRDGRSVMVAANGDELHCTYAGTGSPPGKDGSSAITGTYIITGGTGRFSDAVGDGTIDGSANAVTGILRLTYGGTINELRMRETTK